MAEGTKQPDKEAPKQPIPGFKAELQGEILNTLSAFLQTERGNRVTPNNMAGLIISIQELLRKNKADRNMEVIKEIIIDTCFDCPYFNRSINEKRLCKRTGYCTKLKKPLDLDTHINIHPDCPLQDCGVYSETKTYLVGNI